jgi:hypothetical protein
LIKHRWRFHPPTPRSHTPTRHAPRRTDRWIVSANTNLNGITLFNFVGNRSAWPTLWNVRLHSLCCCVCPDFYPPTVYEIL